MFAFRVDATREIGQGHFRRCLNIANTLKQLNQKTLFMSANLPEELKLLLQEHGHSFYQLQEIEAGLNTFRTSLDDCKCIIVDHYGLDDEWEKQFKVVGIKVAVFDDMAKRRHSCDLLVDHAYFPRAEHRYNKLVPHNCELLLGPDYLLLERDYHGIQNNVNRDQITMFFGGGETLELGVTSAEALMEHSSLPLNIVLSGSMKKSHFSRISENYPSQVQLFENVPTLAPLYQRSVFSIGAGGISTWERLSCRVPSLVFITAENQRASIETLEGIGLVYKMELGELEDLPKHLIQFTKNFLPKFDDNLESAPFKIDGLGSDRVAKRLIKLTEKN